MTPFISPLNLTAFNLFSITEWALLYFIAEAIFTVLTVYQIYDIGSQLTFLGSNDLILHLISTVAYLAQLLAIVYIPWRTNLPNVWRSTSLILRWFYQSIKRCSFDGNDYLEVEDEKTDHLFSFPGLYKRLKKYESIFDRTMLVSSVFLFYVWPITNVILMMFVTVKLDVPKNENCTRALVHVIIGRTMQTPVLLYFGFFTWVVFLLRKTIQDQMQKVVETSDRESTSEIELGITNIWLDSEDYRTVIGRYICFTTAAGTLAILVQLLRPYQPNDDLTDPPVTLVTWWLWSEKMMFPIQAVVAAGNIDIDYIWGNFKTNLIKKLVNSPDNKQKLQDILKHMRINCTIGNWFAPTLAIVVITVFVSMSFPDQTALYYQRPGC